MGIRNSACNLLIIFIAVLNFPILSICTLKIADYIFYVCVCVCVRERERERNAICLSVCFIFPFSPVIPTLSHTHTALFGCVSQKTHHVYTKYTVMCSDSLHMPNGPINNQGPHTLVLSWGLAQANSTRDLCGFEIPAI